MNRQGPPGGFLLDTDFLIDLNRGRRHELRIKAGDLLREINTEDLFISDIAVAEFVTGVPEDRQDEAQRMLQELYFYITPTLEEAALAGRLRREWLAKGYTLALSDVTNAALALSQHLVLVTRNLQHYPFPQLKIRSW